MAKDILAIPASTVAYEASSPVKAVGCGSKSGLLSKAMSATSSRQGTNKAHFIDRDCSLALTLVTCLEYF
ncbi:hypothetical protein Tco_1097084 [Tanacetum coccineum]